MRLWSLHPKYLDLEGLTRNINEAILAYKVLTKRTKGYKNHPQLKRWTTVPLDSLTGYIEYLMDYKTYLMLLNVDRSKEAIPPFPEWPFLVVTEGQLKYEFNHLQKKLYKRNQAQYLKNKKEKVILCHPTFETKCGGVEEWEKVK